VADTYSSKYIDVSAILNHRVDELLVGVLKQVRLRRSSSDVFETTPRSPTAAETTPRSITALETTPVDEALPPSLRRPRGPHCCGYAGLLSRHASSRPRQRPGLRKVSLETPRDQYSSHHNPVWRRPRGRRCGDDPAVIAVAHREVEVLPQKMVLKFEVLPEEMVF